MMKKFIENPASVLFLTVLLFSIVGINAAAVIYGTQIAGIFLCLILAYYFYGFPNKKAVFLCVGITIFIGILSIYQFSYLEYKGIFWKNTIRTLFWISSAVIFYSYFSQYLKEKHFSIIIPWFIVLNAFVVIIQFVSFYLFNIELDFSLWLGGEGVRSYYSAMQGLTYRPTGLTSEPAIHSGIMMGLLVLYYLLDNEHNKTIDIVGILSIILTFSTLGVLLVLAYSALVYTRKRSTVIIGIIVSAVIGFFIWDSLVARYDAFMSGTDISNNVKYEVFKYLFSDLNTTLFGVGFVGKDSQAPIFYDALYDMTYFFNLYIYFGVIIGSLLLVFSLYLLIRSHFLWREKLLILVVLIKLSGPTFMFFSFFIMSLFLLNHFREMKQ